MENILIAGATGGIGQALVREAVHRWPAAKIWVLGRDRQKLQALERYSQVESIPAELEKWSDEDFVADLQQRIQSLDLVIYAIGVLNAEGKRPEKSLKEFSEQSFVESVRINTTGAMLLAKIIKPLLKRSGKGRYIALSAKVGSIDDNGLGGWHSYRMSKAALNMGMKNVAIEFQQSGCRSIVASVHPGTTLTDFSREFVGNWDKSKVAVADVTAKRLLDLCEKLEASHNASFLHWDGTRLPW